VLSLPKVPMPVEITGTRPVAPVRSGAAALALSQLEAGAVTPEQAWASGALTVDDVVAALEQRRLFESEDPAQVRLREGLVKLLVRHGETRWLPQPTAPTSTTASTPLPKPLSGRVRLAVADYLSHAGDERAVAVYEDLLRETERTKGQGPPVRVVGAVNHLASHYVRHGQLQKAVELYLGAEKYSTSPYWHASLRLHVARLYRQMGAEQKAQEFYAQVAKSDNAWAAALVVLDQARDLMTQGRHEEARKLLEQSVNEARTEPVKVALLALLGHCHYLAGDFGAARRLSQEAVERFEALPPGQRGNNLETTLKMAQRTLRQVQQWTQAPITVEPQELRFSVSPEQQTPVIRRLSVRTFQAIPLTVSTDNPLIQARVLADSGWGDEPIKANPPGITKEVIVEIAPEALQKSSEASLTVSSPKFPGFQVRVPLQFK
ncbi:MAG: tetratricopeptide repeat protein, partial [Armatimonadota bacterium]|nr:tetratricopeptide repeat protein [Armatimonadota bacterium]